MTELPISASQREGLLRLAVRPGYRGYAAVKRGVDVVLGVVALILLSPVLGICAAIIKLSSKGPVLHTQIRAAKHGRLFNMYKLRTMRMDAEFSTGAVWASDEDPRVIPACRWMRRSHVDELPQLMNVMLGQMSLVGPRPERPEILEDLTRHYPNAKMRLAVPPGITGLAQIRWGYDTTPQRFRRKLQADLEYIVNRRLTLDARIIFATVPKFVDRQSK